MCLVALAQHHIGAQKPLPSFDIATILSQPIGEPRHHAADHLIAVLFAHRTGGCHVLGAWPPLNGGRGHPWFGAPPPPANIRPPRRPGCRSRRLVNHLTPNCCGFATITVLFGSNPNVKLRLELTWLKYKRPFESRFGIRCYDAVGCRDESLTKVRLPLGILSAQRDQFTTRID